MNLYDWGRRAMDARPFAALGKRCAIFFADVRCAAGREPIGTPIAFILSHMKKHQLALILSFLLTAISPVSAIPGETNGLILNFHGVPLRTALDYLADQAGLTAVYDTDIRGDVNIRASRPVSSDEALNLLEDQLARNHYTAFLDGRTLTVMDASSARTNPLTPVVTLTNADTIPVNNSIVTEILPVHTLNPEQLAKDLGPLIPPEDTVTANESGSAILITASQKDIHRLAEMITALDSTAVSEVNVFTLNHADAKSVADELKELFQSGGSEANRAEAPRIIFGGRVGPAGGDAKGKIAPVKPVFVADEQLNAVAASAPPDCMRTIARVVSMLDRSGEELQAVEIFPLMHADPGEIADEISVLFAAAPAAAAVSEPAARTAGFRFAGPIALSAPAESSRLKRQAAVTVVADRRTESVIVSAAVPAMAQIKEIIARLDANELGIMKLSVFPLEFADAGSAQEAFEALFGKPGSSGPSQPQITTPFSARAEAEISAQSQSAASAGTGLSSKSSPAASR